MVQHADIDHTGITGVGVGVLCGAKVYHNTTEAINNTFFSMNAEDFDTDGFHDNATNNSRLTVPTGKDGTYVAIGHWYTGTATERACSLRLNGSTLIRGTYAAAQFGGVTITVVQLVATDYVQLFTTESATFGHATNPERMNSLSLHRIA